MAIILCYTGELLIGYFSLFSTAYPNEFPVIIIIREWKDILAKNEFRGFVSKRKLTALSQYCYMQYYPELVKEKKKYKRLIKKFFESIKDSIPMENSVVDFGVFEDGTVKIIEINPFVRYFKNLTAFITHSTHNNTPLIIL